jgi:hypothetical protein
MTTAGLLRELMHRTALDGSFTARNIVTPSGGRRRGLYPSRFGMLPYEAPLECDLIKRLDGSWTCTEFVTQALQLLIRDRRADQESFRYTPDACVRHHGGRISLIECKPDDLLDEFNRPRGPKIQRYLQSLDIDFLVLTESELHPGLRQANASMLSCNFRRALKPALVRQLQERTTKAQPSTFGALAHALGLGDARTALARGFVFFDTAALLTESTPIHPTFHEALDAADFLCA